MENGLPTPTLPDRCLLRLYEVSLSPEDGMHGIPRVLRIPLPPNNRLQALLTTKSVITVAQHIYQSPKPWIGDIQWHPPGAVQPIFDLALSLLISDLKVAAKIREGSDNASESPTLQLGVHDRRDLPTHRRKAVHRPPGFRVSHQHGQRAVQHRMAGRCRIDNHEVAIVNTPEKASGRLRLASGRPRAPNKLPQSAHPRKVSGERCKIDTACGSSPSILPEHYLP